MAKKTTQIQVNPNETIIDCNLVDTMEQDFLDYSLSVITDRAIPSVYDGLKPSQRQALYTMWRLGLFPNKNTIKEQSVIGEAMRTCYQHGDAGIKSTIDRMAQSWVLNCPMVYPGGTVGNPDGVSMPASARYLEVKMTAYGKLMTDLLDKDTVDMIDTFSGICQQPTVLPSLYPNILVNDSSGIAVGLATDIPSHNLIEACDATIAYLRNPDITYEELVKILPAPDFPLGGEIINSDHMIDCYRTGRGRCIVRGVPTINKNIISFKEIPYEVGTIKIVDKILSLVESGELSQIIDVYDNTGYNEKEKTTTAEICIQIAPSANVNKVLEELYAKTPLQSTVNFNMVALVGKEPKLLSLKDILHHYSSHLCEIHRRALTYDYNDHAHKEHIQQAYKAAVLKIDDVIKTIKSSSDKTDGIPKLMTLLNIDDEQANAVWERQLGSLSKMNVDKIEENIKAEQAKMLDFKDKLNNLTDYVISSLNEIKKLGTPRKTKLSNIDISEQKTKKEVEEETIRVNFNKITGIVKQSRMGQIECSNLEDIFAFTEQGKFIKLPGHLLPYDDKKLSQLDPNDKVVFVATLQTSDIIYQVTKNGYVKAISAKEYITFSRKSGISIKLKQDDSVICTLVSTSKGLKIHTNKNISDIDKVLISNRGTLGKKIIIFDKDEKLVKVESI